MTVLLKNNVSSTLATAISPTDTGIVVASGSRFPTITSGDYFYVTLVSQAGQTEIVKVTARVGNSMTVVRAQDGSSAASFQVGALVDMRVNVASISELRDEAVEVSIADAGGYYTSGTVEGALQEVGELSTYATVGELLASTLGSRGLGTLWTAGPYVYKEVSTGEHITTAGGVKLQVQLTSEGGIPLAAFGITTDGTGDNSTKIKLATAYAASLGFIDSITNTRSYHPSIMLPSGRIRFTEAGTLTTGFTSGVSSGLRFVGQGIGSTHLIYDNTANTADTSHAAVGTSLTGLAFEYMQIEVRNGKRFILWQNGGGGGGAWLYHNRVKIIGGTGGYDRYLDIAGTSLGSETMWEECRADVPTGGTLFYVRETNPQAVNHNFNKCSFASLTNGTVFRIRAGGNIRWFGGYGSFGDGSKFLFVDPPSIGLIGVSNSDFTFVGWHPEVVGGNTGAFRIVEATRGGNFYFVSCNLSLLVNTTSYEQFYARQAQQTAMNFVFNQSQLTVNVKFNLSGRSDVFFINSEHPDWNSMVTTYDRFDNSEYLSPVIHVSSPRSTNVLPADPFIGERASSSGITPIGFPPAVPLKCYFVRNGAGLGRGVSVGFNNSYASIQEPIPLGSLIRSVTLVYFETSPIGGVTQFKVTNFDESYTFIPETTISTGRQVIASSAPLMYICDTLDRCNIKVWGRTNTASAATSIDQRVYAVVEYY